MPKKSDHSRTIRLLSVVYGSLAIVHELRPRTLISQEKRHLKRPKKGLLFIARSPDDTIPSAQIAGENAASLVYPRISRKVKK